MFFRRLFSRWKKWRSGDTESNVPVIFEKLLPEAIVDKYKFEDILNEVIRRDLSQTVEHKEYVLIFAERGTNEVLLIEKQKPLWQKNRLNLLGGKIEDSDRSAGLGSDKVAALYAANRELIEESGYGGENFVYSGKVVGNHFDYNFTVHVVRCQVSDTAEPNPGENEIEKVHWYQWEEVKNSPALMPNLRVIIPLVRCHLDDWVITDNGESQKEKRHSFAINVKGGLE